MLAALGIAVTVGFAVMNVGTGIYVLVSALRSRPDDPEEQERALMRSLAWPAENGDGFADASAPEMYAEPENVDCRVSAELFTGGTES